MFHLTRNGGSEAMRNLTGLKSGLLALCLLMIAAPAAAQLADPRSLAASGVLLPFFSDTTAGFVSVLEYVSPVVPSFTNPIHTVFFNATYARVVSQPLLETAKQAEAIITSVPLLSLNFNPGGARPALGVSRGGRESRHR
jgi:hypothetical protein